MSMRPAHVACTAAALLMLAVSTARAQEASDSRATATPIAAVPFSALTPTSGATTAADEPRPGCITFGDPATTGDHSVWYRYTATDARPLVANTFGSTYDTVLVVWDGAGEVGCNDDSDGLQSQVAFTTEAGHTYYVQIAFWQYPGLAPDPMLSFQLAPPLPPLEATVVMEAIGRASGATGVIEIGGTITCSRPAWVDAVVHVQQQHGRIAAAAVFLQGPCGPEPQRAAGRFVGQNARFTPGQAIVTVMGSAAENPWSPTAVLYAQSALRLQGASPKALALPPPPQP